CGGAFFYYYPAHFLVRIYITKLLKGSIQKRHWNQKKQLFIPSCTSPRQAMWSPTGDKIGKNKIAKSLTFSDLATKNVVLPGFEPRQAEPKTAVLPLHHKTILFAQRVHGCLSKALQR
ncbi:hypothetical protein, partial [uncultured Duncaniella sp.]|uniref:hypothetical protein n=1 Tax=uncultured Duncaniella sp. TaxID=2768039 RepID=UPI0025A9D269